MELSNMTAEELAAHLSSTNQIGAQQQPQEPNTPPDIANQPVQDLQNQPEPPAQEEGDEGKDEPEGSENNQNQDAPSEPEISEELQSFFNEFDQKLLSDDLLLPFATEDGQDHIRPKSLDDIAELVRANKERWVEEARTQDQEALLQDIFSKTSPAFQFIAKNAVHFKTPEELIPLITSVQTQDQVANINLDTPKGQEQIVRFYLQMQGFDENAIEDEVTDLREREKLADRATKVQPVVSKHLEDNTARILKEKADAQYQDQLFWNNYYNKLGTDLIDAKEIDGMSLSKDHKNMVAGALIPNQQTGNVPILEMVDKLIGDGNITKLTKLALLLQEDEQIFDSYYGTKKSTQVARSLMKTLKTNLKASTSQDVPNNGTSVKTPKPATVKSPGTGYGTFL